MFSSHTECLWTVSGILEAHGLLPECSRRKPQAVDSHFKLSADKLQG